MKYIIVESIPGNSTPLYQIYEREGDIYRTYRGTENYPTTLDEARRKLSFLEDTRVIQRSEGCAGG